MSSEWGCQVDASAGIGLPFFDDYPAPVPVASAPGVSRSIRPVRGREYVVAGPLFSRGTDWRQLSEHDITNCNRAVSRGIIRAMFRDPNIKPSFETLKYAVVSGVLNLTPATNGRNRADGEDEAEIELANEITEFCQRALNRAEEHISVTLAELFNALAYRNKVAERVEEAITEGPDAGRYSLARIAVKPHWSYNFLVDSKNRVQELRCLVEEDGKLVWRDLPRSSFVVAAWACEDGDPRGNSMFDAAYQSWVFKQNLMKPWWKGLQQFGTPSLFGTTPEGAEDTYDRDPETGEVLVDENGDPLPTKNPQLGMRQSIEDFYQSGSVIVGPHGSTLQVIESNRDASGIATALDRCDADITRTLLLQTRATREAKFGSKADSQTGQDILSVFVMYLRTWLCAIVDRDILFPLVEINWGTEVANRLTPNASLGKISPEDLVKAANAIAALLQSGYFTEEQLAECDAMLGLPVRAPGAERVGPQSSAQPDPSADPNAADQTGDPANADQTAS